MKPLNTTLPIAPVELHKTKTLPPAGKEYFCFQINSKYPHAAQCVKSWILNKAIDYILSIDKFEQQCVVTDNSPNVPITPTPIKNPSASKSLCLFTKLLDVKPKTAKRRIVATKYKRRAMKVGYSQVTKKKRKRHSKINEQIKRNLYAWITRHPQVVQSPISNDCLKVMFDDQT